MNAPKVLLKGALHRLVDSAIALDEAQAHEYADAKEMFLRNVSIVLSILDARGDAS